MKNKKGITVVSLIITIVIILILVGVTVNVTLNEELFIETKEASSKMELAQIRNKAETVKKTIMSDREIDEDKLISVENFRDELLKEFNLEQIDKDGNTIIDVNDQYVILVYSGLDYKVVEKSKLYLTAEEAESVWTTNGAGTITGYLGNDAEVIVPLRIGEENINGLAKYLFSENQQITSVIIPEGIKMLDAHLFYKSTNLREVLVPNGITSIQDRFLAGCTSIKNITIPETVNTIGNNVFNGCTSLTNIIIPNSVTSIGEAAFRDCISLTYVEIPKLVTSIKKSIFNGCTNLTNITIPDSVISIGEYAFNNCTNLTSITIPNSVTSIESTAFSSCDNLTNIYFIKGTNEKPSGEPWGATNATVTEIDPPTTE